MRNQSLQYQIKISNRQLRRNSSSSRHHVGFDSSFYYSDNYRYTVVIGSPPAGWQQAEECEPIVNNDLLAALANLTPGEVHELHAAAESQPSIVVHTANLQDEEEAANQQLRVGIIPTKCPERI